MADILIVDDEVDICTQLKGLLEDVGFKAQTAHNSQDALKSLGTRRPDLVILDIWLENSQMDGLGILAKIHKEYAGLPVIMISGHGTIEMAIKATRLGAFDFIEKPFKTDIMLLVVRRAIETARLRRENEELRLKFGMPQDITGLSAPMNHVRQTIEKAAPTGSRVLVTGPSGSGKELVARRIHALSKRASAPFVVANCAELTPDRFDMEMFGQELPIKIGLLEQAEGGTLLLNEVSDLSQDAQGKLLRILQDQSFTRKGGNVTVNMDVRFIATSKHDLRGMVTLGKFREDLFFRLHVVPIALAPLSDRVEDIPALCKVFMHQISLSSGLAMLPFRDDALAALQSYKWPGNVRQLRNVVEWIMIMAPQNNCDAIRGDMLPPDILGQTSPILRSDMSAELLSLPLREAREMFERDYLLAQVNRYAGNISKTASFIGMERSALHRKLKTLGVGQNHDNSNEAADVA